MGMNPNAMQQPAQSSVRTLGKSKPITLSSLGAGKIGYNGSKSLSTSTPIETVETLDTPEEMVEDTTPSVVSDFLNHIDL